MKKLSLTALLLLGFAGSAAAQGPQDVVIFLNNIDNGVNGLVGGLAETTINLMEGEVEATAVSLGGTLTGLAVNLSDRTLLEDLGPAAVDLGNTLVAAGQPLYDALQGPASQLATLAEPLSGPTIALIEAIEFNLVLDIDEAIADSLPIPGLDGLGLPIPGTGDGSDSPLPSLPGLDSLLGLLDGLPGLENLPL